MSLDTTAKANKRAALEQLRFNKVKKQCTAPSTSALDTPPTSSNDQPPSSIPPLQSRDATSVSRYFLSPPSNGIVLVPNSSPIASDVKYNSQQSHHRSNGNDVAQIPGLIHSNPWGQPRRPMGIDPLSAPSGFVNHSSGHHALFPRPRNGSDMQTSDIDRGVENKRVHHDSSSSVDQLDVLNTPTSPGIQRLGKRRRIVSNGNDGRSSSSDESMPDIQSLVAGPPKPRIMRGRPSSQDPPHADTSQSESEDPIFTRFKLTMPQYPPHHTRMAWDQAHGDVKQATALLSDPFWDPKPSPSLKSSPDSRGKVKEVEEFNKALRAAAKEKGKKSMIYANRTTLDTKPPHPSSPPLPSSIIDLTASSPPIAQRIARKRVKKMVESDSELEFVDSHKEPDRRISRGQQGSSDEDQALNYFNSSKPEALQELTGCTPEQASAIIAMRPFDSVDDLNAKLGQGKKKAGPAGISPRMFEDCTIIFEGYGEVDSILEDCERIGSTLRVAIASWTESNGGKAKETSLSNQTSVDPLMEGDTEEGSLSLVSISPLKVQKPKDYLVTQPALLAEDVQLKEYQLLGVNWLQLLYRRKLSCILADEMGLGKTIQVISFFAHLKEKGSPGPHLVVVPSSTLENWCREFARFAPSISIQTYYAGKEERPALRQMLLDTQRRTSKNDEGWEVLITTYNLAQGDDRDRKFFRRVEWDTCVFDEGHVLKNFQSQRYQALLRFTSKWRLLLTGTPLQNNLQELVSLMNFILPHHFAESLESLRAIFKAKGDSKVTLLAQERVSRAKKMMTPFVLRRRKDQVLKDLPKKTERIEWCELTALQKSIYNGALQRSRKTVFDAEVNSAETTDAPAANGKGKAVKKKTRATARTKDKMYLENSSNVLMELRKAASHPMLFRTRFDDQALTGMAKQLLKEPDFKKRGALFDLVKEDMTVMTDAELQLFCSTYKSIRKYLQDDSCYLEAGKVTALLNLLTNYFEQGRKVLIFSQFTQILDILQAILNLKGIKYLLLTGSTPVDVRQSLVDEFTEDDSVPVFLLSTKAGGMGINLTAASVVIMFDQDFNPHNDRQAQDRAYRIGQQRDVEVVKLITRGTIEEDMLRLGETKLALDEAVAGESEELDQNESVQAKMMKSSLMSALRKQFEEQQEQHLDGDKSRGTSTGNWDTEQSSPGP